MGILQSQPGCQLLTNHPWGGIPHILWPAQVDTKSFRAAANFSAAAGGGGGQGQGGCAHASHGQIAGATLANTKSLGGADTIVHYKI